MSLASSVAQTGTHRHTHTHTDTHTGNASGLGDGVRPPGHRPRNSGPDPGGRGLGFGLPLAGLLVGFDPATGR